MSDVSRRAVRNQEPGACFSPIDDGPEDMVETRLQYEIQIHGHLAPHRLRHFDGQTVRQEAGGETVIVGCFRDQPALYGLLSWLQGLGATLLLTKRVEE